MVRVVVPKEISADEARVAMTPMTAGEFLQLGCVLTLQNNAGFSANFADSDYANVQFVTQSKSLYQEADIILKVEPPLPDEIRHFKKGAILVSFLYPHRHPESVQALCDQHITSFALERLPRISRAQNMDALSSQATVAGYKAALLAANHQQRFFPMLTTAAGTIRPTHVLVIGAGVAGLQAIATAKRLGAVVFAYDIRPAAREQVESLGGKMIDIGVSAEGQGGYARELSEDEKATQQKALFDAVSKAEVVICTALIPGKPAPKIISKAMVEAMPAGGVIIDIAAEMGGNCELTQAGKVVKHGSISIEGATNLPSLMARDASTMFAKNVLNFAKLFIKDNQIQLDWKDQILMESVVTHEGKRGEQL
jgi:NAD(P) transhydrogenase subunit alpha